MHTWSLAILNGQPHRVDSLGRCPADTALPSLGAVVGAALNTRHTHDISASGNAPIVVIDTENLHIRYFDISRNSNNRFIMKLKRKISDHIVFVKSKIMRCQFFQLWQW